VADLAAFVKQVGAVRARLEGLRKRSFGDEVAACLKEMEELRTEAEHAAKTRKVSKAASVIGDRWKALSKRLKDNFPALREEGDVRRKMDASLKSLNALRTDEGVYWNISQDHPASRDLLLDREMRGHRIRVEGDYFPAIHTVLLSHHQDLGLDSL